MLEQRRHVLVGDFHGVDGDVGEWVDLLEVCSQRFGFVLAEVLEEVLLAVEVGHVDAVEINEVQVSDADARQGDGDGRAEPAEPANRHMRGVELVLRGGGVPVEQGRANLLAADERGRVGQAIEGLLSCGGLFGGC